METNKKIIILGAGPVGLVTGWELAKRGESIHIYEKNDISGGMCRTWQWGKYLVDTGPHIFHTPEQTLAEYWEKEFGDLFVKGEFWCKNVRGKDFNEYWDYPISWESISKYPEDLKKKIISEIDELTLEDKATATNYADYVRGLVGPTLEGMFFRTYPEKIWGIPTSEMTPEWAPKRIEFRHRNTPFYNNQWNAVGKYGTGCIYSRIEQNILALGGSIHFNYSVSGLGIVGNQIRRVEFTNGSSVNVQPQDIVISSLPITVTAGLLGYDSTLTFRGIKSVYLAYNKEQILPNDIHWLYFGSNDILFNRITEPKKLSPFVSPDKSSYLTVETTFNSGDKIDSLSSAELIDIVAGQVEKTGLVNNRLLLDTSINTERFVYPLLYKGYGEELAVTRAHLTKYQQLYSIGSGGDFNYADSQILFHKAFDVAEIICGKGSHLAQVIRKTPSVNFLKKVSIGSVCIGDGEKSFIIAEAGLNHNGSLAIAKKLVDAALLTGCDAIKFQTFRKHSRVSSQVKNAKYAETVIGLEETMSEMFARLAMPYSEQRELFEYAQDRNIEVFSTPFDIESVEFLESVGVKLYKISSMDLVNLPLIREVALTGKPILLSTGMSTLGDVEEAVDVVCQQGNRSLVLLHCNSSYPAALGEMNLNMINSLKQAFEVPVGLSDHTFGLFAAHTAIAIGADVIERHFTLDRSYEGPDHILSSEPAEMTQLVAVARNMPLVLGNGTKRIQPNEYDTLNTQRKSLYAATDIKRGDILTKEMITIKGPGGGLLPKYLNVVIGRKAALDVLQDHPITWDTI